MVRLHLLFVIGLIAVGAFLVERFIGLFFIEIPDAVYVITIVLVAICLISGAFLTIKKQAEEEADV